MSPETTKEKIMKATLKIISQEGTNNVTVRKIAEKAEVNVASVNYHFGSKDYLVKSSLGYFITEMNNCFSYLEQENLPVKERLKEFFKEYTENLMKNPGVIKSLVTKIMNNDSIKPELKESMQDGFKALHNTIGKAIDIGDELNEKYITFFTMASLVYPVLYDEQMNSLFGIDYKNPNCREDYINLLLKLIIGNGLCN